jgi:O-antigen ligase
VCIAGATLAAYNVLFMTQGRTGYLVLASLLLLFTYQMFRMRGVLAGLAALTLLGAFAYSMSSVVGSRVDEVSTDWQGFRDGKVDTSVAYRLAFYENSARLLAKNPLLGAGAGTFDREYRELAAETGSPRTGNPHNEYLMIAVQWGFVGVGLFIGLLCGMWRFSARLSITHGRMAQGVVVAMAVGCVFNSLLLDFTEGHAFVYLTGVLFAGLPPSRS